jgi:plasmid stabilization system protein ParE
MGRSLVFRDVAIADAIEAYGWYEKRSTGLGERFLNSVDECIAEVCRDPERFAFAFNDFRRSIVHRFPYVVFYKFDDYTVTICSIFHSSQNPKILHQRLR